MQTEIPRHADPDARVELVIYGATPAGIAAALSAAREGISTLLLAEGSHVGGMTASGLCTTDAVRREAYGGILLEFVGRVREFYLETYGPESATYRACRDGWWYEPNVAERVFEAMLEAQPKLTVLRDQTLESVETRSDTIVSLITLDSNGHRHTSHASVFIDASYEGDLAALAGVPYRVGRESRVEFRESLAGVVYQDWKKGVLLDNSTGEGHPGIQAYCFRQTLTSKRKNQVPIEKPSTYEAHLPDYLPLVDDFSVGRVTRIDDVTMVNALMNDKIDANGNIEGLTGLNLPGRNWDYPEASAVARAKIVRWHRDHAHGLMWFMQNDARVPQALRAEFCRWHFCADEYVHDEHQPWQIYVRQGRRIAGRALLTEHDFRIDPATGQTPHHEDSIAVAEHSFDIHPCQDRSATVNGWMEGVLWFPDKANGPAQPGQIPFGAILPKNLENLLVPVAMSATHVAFSVVRMEPVWMATGQAAGLAAAMAIRQKITPTAISVPKLQSMLLEKGQIIDYKNGRTSK
jgi:FAD-dependent oxidoreductase family protein